MISKRFYLSIPVNYAQIAENSAYSRDIKCQLKMASSEDSRKKKNKKRTQR